MLRVTVPVVGVADACHSEPFACVILSVAKNLP